jgi:hypothetical protein
MQVAQARSQYELGFSAKSKQASLRQTSLRSFLRMYEIAVPVALRLVTECEDARTRYAGGLPCAMDGTLQFLSIYDTIIDCWQCNITRAGRFNPRSCD